MSTTRTPRGVTQIDRFALSADDAMRPGRGDPITVLALWCLRRSFPALLFGGLMAATLSGSYSSEALGRLTDPGELWDALFSPLVGVALAFAVRLAVGGLALASAFPLSLGTVRATEDRPRLRARWRVWSDRLRVSRAYRAVRWTWAVRGAAVARLGDAGRWLVLLDRALLVLAVVFAVGWVVAVAMVPIRG